MTRVSRLVRGAAQVSARGIGAGVTPTARLERGPLVVASVRPRVAREVVNRAIFRNPALHHHRRVVRVVTGLDIVHVFAIP